MKLANFEAVVRALNAANVHCLVVGGLAVNAHGYARFTEVVDLVIRLTKPQILAAFKALGKVGCGPAAPVAAREFADPANRERWAKTEKMAMLQMWSDKHCETPVDIFVNKTFDFATEYKTALVESLSPGAPVRFGSL
jgi:hypothetical protein